MGGGRWWRRVGGWVVWGAAECGQRSAECQAGMGCEACGAQARVPASPTKGAGLGGGGFLRGGGGLFFGVGGFLRGGGGDLRGGGGARGGLGGGEGGVGSKVQAGLKGPARPVPSANWRTANSSVVVVWPRVTRPARSWAAVKAAGGVGQRARRQSACKVFHARCCPRHGPLGGHILGQMARSLLVVETARQAGTGPFYSAETAGQGCQRVEASQLKSP